jgi:hypothetical protein
MTRPRVLHFARIAASIAFVWTVSIVALHQAITFGS